MFLGSGGKKRKQSNWYTIKDKEEKGVGSEDYFEKNILLQLKEKVLLCRKL
jgi:hypothetical protein